MLQLGAGLFGAGAEVVVALCDVVAGAAHAVHLLAHVVHQRFEVQARLVHGPHEHADFVDAVEVQVLPGLPGRDGLRLGQHLFERAHDLGVERPDLQCGAHGEHAGQAEHAVVVQAQEVGAEQRGQRDADQGQCESPGQRQGLPDGTPGHPPGVDDQPPVEGALAGTAFAEVPVGVFGRLHLGRHGLGPHRHVAHHGAAADHGGGVGAHPVVVAVLAAVLDQGRPRLTGLQRGPHVGKGLGGHVRVADHVVGLPEYVFTLETTDLDEGLVGVGDVALRVGARHQGGVGRKVVLALGDRQVLAHGVLPRQSGCPVVGMARLILGGVGVAWCVVS